TRPRHGHGSCYLFYRVTAGPGSIPSFACCIPCRFRRDDGHERGGGDRVSAEPRTVPARTAHQGFDSAPGPPEGYPGFVDEGLDDLDRLTGIALGQASSGLGQVAASAQVIGLPHCLTPRAWDRADSSG